MNFFLSAEAATFLCVMLRNYTKDEWQIFQVLFNQWMAVNFILGLNCFPLFLGMVMCDNEFETMENKI